MLLYYVTMGAVFMSKGWQEWRDDLHKDNPAINPEYVNKKGVWHHDFYRDRPTAINGGGLFYPSQDDRPVPTGTIGGFNKADLLRSGWTRTSIKRILGEPDFRVLRQGLFGPLRKDRPECVYTRERVLAAEKDGKIRFRQAPKRRDPSETDYWESAELGRALCGPGSLPKVSPGDWLPLLKRWDFHRIGVRYPWWLDRLVFTSQDSTLHLYVGHVPNIHWPCPECGKSCRLYDHRPERVWRRGTSIPVWGYENGQPEWMGDVPVIVHGRQPRCHCPEHGPRSLSPLQDFSEAENVPENVALEWVIQAST